MTYLYVVARVRCSWSALAAAEVKAQAAAAAATAASSDQARETHQRLLANNTALLLR